MSWLWRNDSSPASFEKALSKLSSQINAATISLDKSRSRARRAKALWTLYTTLAYLVSALIVLLVIGPQACGLPHYAGLVAGPFVIYGGRKATTAVFGWSVSRQQSYVNRLQRQRDEKITELKKATRYDSTQELLSKYGGASPPQTPRENESKGGGGKKQAPQNQTPVQRTGLPPPPTANIPGRVPANRPVTPQSQQQRPPYELPTPQSMARSPVQVEEPGFAPNAFPQAPPAYQSPPQSHWYDRILDVMLGEDETLAKNRLVLLCSNPSCRLVNGQAPPGVKTLEELGRWRCQGCGSWNGDEPTSEVRKAIKEVTGASPAARQAELGALVTEREPLDLVEQEGATGRDVPGKDEGSGVTKRVTRSAGKAKGEGH